MQVASKCVVNVAESATDTQRDIIFPKFQTLSSYDLSKFNDDFATAQIM
jgi:hypothetical protein